MGIGYVTERVRTESTECQILAEHHFRFHVGVEVPVILILFYIQ